MTGKAQGNTHGKGFYQSLVALVVGSIQATSPVSGTSKKGSEVVRFPVRIEIEGATWGGTLNLTRYNSRFDGMSEDEIARAKDNEKLAKVLGCDPDEVPALMAAAKAQVGK